MSVEKNKIIRRKEEEVRRGYSYNFSIRAPYIHKWYKVSFKVQSLKCRFHEVLWVVNAQYVNCQTHGRDLIGKLFLTQYHCQFISYFIIGGWECKEKSFMWLSKIIDAIISIE